MAPRRTHFPGPLASVLLVAAAWMLTAIGIVVQLDPNAPPTAIDVGRLGVAVALGFGIVATLAARLVPEPQAERLGLRVFEARQLPALLLLVPFVVVASEIDNWVVALGPALDPERIEALRALRDAEYTPLAIAQMWLAQVGLIPVVVEWLFRGVILQGAVAHLGRTVGLWFTAVLSFGSMPMLGVHPLAAAALALVAGYVLGCVRLATGSVLAPILLHAGWNAVGIGATLLAGSLPIPGLNVPDTHTPPWLFGICLAAVVWAGLQVRAEMARQPAVLPIPEPGPEEDEEDGGFF